MDLAPEDRKAGMIGIDLNRIPFAQHAESPWHWLYRFLLTLGPD